jgi:hypothetical protein
MTRQLWFVELGRLLRSPYVWGAVAVTLALLVWGHRNRMPNLAEAAVNAATATFVIAAVVMVVANLATLRDQRHGMPETLAALPGQAEVRTRAVLLAAGCLSAVLAAGVIGGFLLVRLTQGPVAGQVDVPEALGAVVAVALLVAFGVALGRWAPSLVATPAVLVVLGLGLSAGPLFLLVWYVPIAAPYEMQVYERPSGPRLAYLIGALALLAALALLRHGRRPVRLGVAAGGLAVALPAVVIVAMAAPSLTGTVVSDGERPAGDPELECTDRNAITYCHLPGFEPWVHLWAEAADPVVEALPPEGRDHLPTIEQWSERGPRPVDMRPGVVVVGLTWGRGDAEVDSRSWLAGAIAALVTGTADPTRTYQEYGAPWCDASGQARTVVALWLAGQAAPLQPATTTDAWGPVRAESYLGDVWYGARELGYAAALLDRDDARELVRERWGVLVDPATTVEQMAVLLGLPEVPAAAAAEPQGTRCG